MAIITVTTLIDSVANDGQVSLREAIQAANTNSSVDGSAAGSGADTIVFAEGLNGTIRLDGGDGAGGAVGGTLSITDDLTIDGDGRITITGDVNNDDTTVGTTDITDIFATAPAALDDNVRLIDAEEALTLKGLTLTGGVATGEEEDGSGGAVRGDDDVTLDGVTVSGNSAEHTGGGIYANWTASVVNSIINGNVSGGTGGGVDAFEASVVASTFSGNSAGGEGGGLNAFDAFVIGSTVKDNSATLSGGGISAHTIGLTNSTVSGNSAGVEGGGLSSGTANIVNSTITGNVAAVDGGGTAAGTNNLTNSIVFGNDSPGAKDVYSAFGATLSDGNIVHGEFTIDGLSPEAVTVADVFASVVSLDPDGAGGRDPFDAGALGDNGGPIQTIGLKADESNPALDASNASAPATDARGEARLDLPGVSNANGGTADLGAFELTLTVTTLDDVVDADDGLLSLREAIAIANDIAGADTITFDASLNGTIRLDGGDGPAGTAGGTLSISDELTIDGDGRITITGDVAGDDVTPVGDITDLAASLTGGPGGASTLGDNVRIIDASAELSVDGLILTGGVALGSGSSRIGGAIVGNNVTLTHSIISGNQADNAGGGIYGDTITVIASTVSGNSAGIDGGGAGGGIAADNVFLIDSTLSGNSAIGTSGNGGAVYAELVNATNTTVAFNSATGSGGGLWASGNIDLISTTVTGNTAAANGGGVYAAGALDLHHTVALGNMAATGDDTWSQQLTFTNQSLLGEGSINGSGPPVTGGGTAENVFAQTVDIDGGSGVVLAGVLASNGGPVQTVALRDHADNVAIDFGHASIEGSTTTDARGMARVDHPDAEGDGDLIIDLGAFEVIHDIVVTTLLDVVDPDDGETSLREAIEFANLNPGADTITFDAGIAGGTIRLTHDDGTLQAAGELTIDGDGRILITGDVAGDDVLLTGTGITDIFASQTADTLADNVQIFSAGVLTLEGLVLTGGVTTSIGGAIVAANVTLTNTTVSGNSASNHGGGLNSVVATLSNSTVSGNSAGTDGGGISAGIVGLTDSTVSGNSAGTDGGGIYATSTATLTNSTVSGNSAGVDGGGIYAGSTATLTNSTVSGNSAADDGGGIRAVTATVANSIVLGNDAGDSDDEIFGTFVGGTRNIIGTDLFNGNDDIGDTSAAQVFAQTVEIAPGILSGVLADNGGPVQTIALKRDLSNPALDASDTSAPANDARGEARQDWAGIANQNGSPADLGAFELQNTAPSATNLTQAKAYLEDAASVALNDIVVSDADVGDTITARLTLANPAAGALTTSGAATYSALTGVWTITGTLAQVNAALAAVAFVPAANFNGDTTIATHIEDAQGDGPADGTISLDGTPVDDAPLIGSNGGGAAATVQVSENTTAVAKVVATDIEGAAVSYAIAGGADAAHFAINAATGALAFKSAPDFEKPADVGANNVYEVIVRASDGGLSDTQALSVSVTDIGGAKIVGTVGDDLIDSGQTVAGRPFPGDEGDRINGKAGDDTITGGAGDDMIKAGRGNDRLGGGDGDDVFFGGRGRNVLTGGQGDDTFIFTRKIALGKITDYEAGEVIQLAKKAFQGIGPKGVLEAKYFHAGADAETRNQKILYDEESGKVLYAKHGSDTENPRAFLKIGKGLGDFDSSDFVVI